MDTRARASADRMGPLDSAFWALEDRHASVHIASVAVFEGAPPTLAEFRSVYRRALPRIPRLRQRMRTVPLQLGRPVWVDEAQVDLDYHVRRTALPPPGGAAELDALMGRLMAAHLDRERPLWEAWLVEGLADGRFAVVTKLHHSMLDGVSGISLLEHIFEFAPDAPRPRPLHWVPHEVPGRVELARMAIRAQLAAGLQLGGQLSQLASHPMRTVAGAARVGRGLAGYANAFVRPVASSPLRGPIGAPRRWVTASVDLQEVQRVRSVLGGSVNDVVLTLATGGLREVLVKRGEPIRPHIIRALVPVSVRARTDDTIDNQVSALLAYLPVECSEPLDRYRAVRMRTSRLKAAHEAEAGVLVTTLGRYVPGPLLAAGLRLASRAPQRVVSTVVTNVPGPAAPMFLLGRRMVAHYPYVPIADDIRIGIAVTNYAGRLWFGVTGDGDSMPDLDVVAAGIESALVELSALTEESP